MGKELPRKISSGRVLARSMQVRRSNTSARLRTLPSTTPFPSAWFFSPKTVEAAINHGLATREQFENWRRLLDQWRDSPGAVSAIAWGEAIGQKP